MLTEHISSSSYMFSGATHKSCPELKDIRYGNVRQDPYSATYNCNKGFKLKEGSVNIRKCSQHNATWSGEVPNCIVAGMN